LAKAGEPWSKARVARAANMTATTYGRIEKGAPTLTSKLDAIATALNVDVTLVLTPVEAVQPVHTQKSNHLAKTRNVRNISPLAAPSPIPWSSRDAQTRPAVGLSSAVIDRLAALEATVAALQQAASDTHATTANARAILEGLVGLAGTAGVLPRQARATRAARPTKARGLGSHR
jgi:transcriptional regulator with XRE-family HTH domain